MVLQGVVSVVFVGASILLAGLAIPLSAIFLRELSRIARMRRRRDDPRSDFLKRLLPGVANGALKDISDVHNAYRMFFGIGSLRASHLEEIGEFLRTAMARIASAPQGSLEARAHGKIQVLRELLAVNQRTLEVELQCVPFSGTPEPERQVLEGVLELTAADTKKVGPKLDALAKGIRVRQDAVEQLGRESGRTLRLAIWGWLGTAGFSILSVILGILALGA
jgi:hypothetical protein